MIIDFSILTKSKKYKTKFRKVNYLENQNAILCE